MSVKTSVITLTYNRPDWLDEAIRSIESQTDQDYEHLVYDNGSTDPRVGEVLREAKKRCGWKFFYASSGIGPVDIVSAHWNVLLGFARGRYVTILDDDNRKRPDFLAAMTAPMEFDGDIGAVSCGWSPIDADGRKSGPDRHDNLGATLLQLFKENMIDSNALCFRRRIVDEMGGFESSLRTCEDWHFVIRLVRNYGIKHLTDALLDYRVHGKSRSTRAESLGVEADRVRIRSELFTKEESAKALRKLR